MDILKQISRDISEKLSNSGFEKDAEELLELVDRLTNESDSERINELKKEIIDRTNVRWLGDLNVQNIDYKEWWRKLEKLRKETLKINK